MFNFEVSASDESESAAPIDAVISIGSIFVNNVASQVSLIDFGDVQSLACLALFALGVYVEASHCFRITRILVPWLAVANLVVTSCDDLSNYN